MKRGFTLIELLAVIVILAIIALIATPIVLNIINDSKKSLVLRNADFYIDALENEIMLENMKIGGTFNPNVCSVNNGKVTCDGKELTIKVDGEVPTSGSITFDGGKVTNVNLAYPSGNVTLNNKGELVLEEFSNKSICTLISGEPNVIGSKYQCKVKDDMESGFEDGYYFFVLSHNEDGTTNLIMERNIHYDSVNDMGIVATSNKRGLVAWNSSGLNSDGPVTAMDYLYNATKDWNNVPNIMINYVDKKDSKNFGYGSIITTNNITKITNGDGIIQIVLTNKVGYENLKARMASDYEIGKLRFDGEHLYYKVYPTWIANYLAKNELVPGEDLQNINEISGYWTLSSDANVFDNTSFASTVPQQGNVESYGNVSDTDKVGVRPVITLNLY